MDVNTQELLLAIYQQSASGDVQIRYSADLKKKATEQAAIQQLVENGYIVKVTPDLCGAICRLTSSGKAFAKTL